MFNPEKLLGGLLRGAMGKGGVGLGAKAAVGLGLLGVAMEAAEHFMNRPPERSGGGTVSFPTTGAPPPPPDVRTASVPPPIPGSARPVPPAPPIGSTASVATSIETSGAQTLDAVLLIRAMIAAANADGVIDENERGRILERLEEVGLDDEERAFIGRELLCPTDLDGIVSAVRSPATAQQVYAVSVAAIHLDTEAERLYLDNLAQRLGLSQAEVAKVHASMVVKGR